MKRFWSKTEVYRITETDAESVFAVRTPKGHYYPVGTVSSSGCVSMNPMMFMVPGNMMAADLGEHHEDIMRAFKLWLKSTGALRGLAVRCGGKDFCIQSPYDLTYGAPDPNDYIPACSICGHRVSGTRTPACHWYADEHIVEMRANYQMAIARIEGQRDDWVATYRDRVEAQRGLPT